MAYRARSSNVERGWAIKLGNPRPGAKFLFVSLVDNHDHWMILRQDAFIVRWLDLRFRIKSYSWIPECGIGDIPLRLPFLYLFNKAELGSNTQLLALRSLAQGDPELMAGQCFLVKESETMPNIVLPIRT